MAYPNIAPFDAPSLGFPTTGPFEPVQDIWSFRDHFLEQPTTPHQHILRGDEFNGGFCAGNTSYASAKVGDKHECRGVGLGGLLAGEWRQTCKEFGTTYTPLPQNPVGTLQVLEIKTEWLYRSSVTDTVAGFPPGTMTAYWTWGIGFDWIGANGVTSGVQSLMLNFYNWESQTHLRALFQTVAAGNVFRGTSVLGVTPYNIMAQNANIPDLRLQVVMRNLNHDSIAGWYAQLLDYFVTVDGGESYTWVGRHVIESGTTGTSDFMRLRRIYLGSGFDYNRVFNGVEYRTTRNWDKLTYIWNPVSHGNPFVWVH